MILAIEDVMVTYKSIFLSMVCLLLIIRVLIKISAAYSPYAEKKAAQQLVSLYDESDVDSKSMLKNILREKMLKWGMEVTPEFLDSIAESKPVESAISYGLIVAQFMFVATSLIVLFKQVLPLTDFVSLYGNSILWAIGIYFVIAKSHNKLWQESFMYILRLVIIAGLCILAINFFMDLLFGFNIGKFIERVGVIFVLFFPFYIIHISTHSLSILKENEEDLPGIGYKIRIQLSILLLGFCAPLIIVAIFSILFP